MYKRGGQKRGGISQTRLAPSSSPFSSSNPQQLYVGGQHQNMRRSSNPQQNIEGLGQMQIESTSIPPRSVSPFLVQHSNDERNIVEKDNRPMICPCGDSFTDATYVMRQLNKIVNNHWQGQSINYTSTPKTVKDLCWNEFKRKFRWDEMEENEVKRIFDKKAMDHIRNVLNKAKRSQEKPNFITDENWITIKRIWETEKSRQRSEQNEKNQASNSDQESATYAGSSINIAKHKKRMANELETESQYMVTFERTLRKKDKTWSGDRVKAIKDKDEHLLMAYSSGDNGVPLPDPSVNSMAVRVEASGGIKRKKIFEVGSSSRIYTTKVALTSSTNTVVSRTQVEEQLSQLKILILEKDKELTETIQKFELLKSQKDKDLKENNERFKFLESRIDFILQHLNLNHNQIPPFSPPTNQSSDGHDD